MSLSPHYIMFIRYKRSQFKYTCYYFIYIFTRYLYKYKRNFFFQKRRRRIHILSLMSFVKITCWVFFKITRYMFKLKSDFLVHNPEVKTSIHVFDHTIKPILLYGCEIWGYFNLFTSQFRNGNIPIDQIFSKLHCESGKDESRFSSLCQNLKICFNISKWRGNRPSSDCTARLVLFLCTPKRNLYREVSIVPLFPQALVARTTYPLFSNFLFTNLFSIKFLYFFNISSLFPYFNLFVSIFI
jgi:hypothetical protein